MAEHEPTPRLVDRVQVSPRRPLRRVDLERRHPRLERKSSRVTRDRSRRERGAVVQPPTIAAVPGSTPPQTISSRPVHAAIASVRASSGDRKRRPAVACRVEREAAAHRCERRATNVAAPDQQAASRPGRDCSDAPSSIAGKRLQSVVVGLWASPAPASAPFPSRPPTTRISRPLQTAVAPTRDSGSGAIRRHVSVAGSYAAARASSGGSGFPSTAEIPLTKSTSSRPVQTPSGCCSERAASPRSSPSRCLDRTPRRGRSHLRSSRRPSRAFPGPSRRLSRRLTAVPAAASGRLPDRRPANQPRRASPGRSRRRADDSRCPSGEGLRGGATSARPGCTPGPPRSNRAGFRPPPHP